MQTKTKQEHKKKEKEKEAKSGKAYERRWKQIKCRSMKTGKKKKSRKIATGHKTNFHKTFIKFQGQIMKVK